MIKLAISVIFGKNRNLIGIRKCSKVLNSLFITKIDFNTKQVFFNGPPVLIHSSKHSAGATSRFKIVQELVKKKKFKKNNRKINVK